MQILIVIISFMLIDTHAHLFWDSFKKDFDLVIQRAIGAGVTTIINVGVNVELSSQATKQKTEPLQSYSSIGIHPQEAIKYFSINDQETNSKIRKDLELLEKIYNQSPNKVIAVGECGLDYSYFKWGNYLPAEVTAAQAKKLQKKLFAAQIELAKKLNLSLLIHIRDDRTENPNLIECWNEVFEMAGEHFGILHCYSGLMPTTKKTLDTNFLVSFAGNITYPKNEYLKEAVKFLPLKKICLETDCPFLPPQSIRGQRNEPSSVKEITQLVADIKGISLEEVANQTTKNVQRLLKI